MKASEFVGSEFLKQEDLETSKSWVIKETRIAQLEDQKKLELVLMYDNIDKNFTLNATNTKKLIDMFGDETDNWRSKTIMLKLVETEFKGKSVMGIRLDVEQTLAKNPGATLEKATVKEEVVEE